jgi:type I restriction enzyme S subunit
VIDLKQVELAQLITPAKVRRAGSGSFPILSMTMHDGLVDQASKFKKRVASLDTSSYKIVKKNQLVVGFPIDEGVLSFQNLYDEAIVSPAYDVWDITNDGHVESRYLERFLRSPHALVFYASKLRGTTARRRTLPDDLFLTLTVPLPPLAAQRRIAEVLDRADALRAKRRAALAQLDTLTQAIFLDLFGDPVSNPKQWPRVPFAQLLEKIDSGWSPTCLDRAVTGDEWGVLKLGAVTWCEYEPSENKALPANVDPEPELEVQPGDVLFVRKNTYELVGACALVRVTPRRLLMSDLIFRLRLRPDAELDPCFLQQLLICPAKRREVQKLAGGSAGSMPNISKSRLQTIPIEIPPLPLQHDLARRVAAVEKLKAAHRASLAEFDALFTSLQHRAFRGEL